MIGRGDRGNPSRERATSGRGEVVCVPAIGARAGRGPMLELSQYSFTAMGTACSLHAFAEGDACASAAFEAATAEVGRIEARYSRYRADSLLSRINATADAGGEIEVDEETAGLLDYAWACHRMSDGLFDISSGILRRAWDFRSGRVPDRAEVEALLPRLGLGRVVWDKPVLRFPTAGMELDLGGIAKEYAADRAALACSALGIRHGLVELGGDIAVIGPAPTGDPWLIGIRRPGAINERVASVRLFSGGLATSGDYERCLVVNGKRYSHLLDPRTGWPVRGLSSVSVVADSCMVAGSVSTIAMLMGSAGAGWLGRLGVEHLCLGEAGMERGTGAFERAAA